MARKAVDSAIALRPGAADQYEQLATVEILARKPAAALTAARKETDPVWRELRWRWRCKLGPTARPPMPSVGLLSPRVSRLATVPGQAARVARHPGWRRSGLTLFGLNGPDDAEGGCDGSRHVAQVRGGEWR
ncbi:MAG: hypothetical protein ACREP0_04075, partial [Rhodanobacteraceae bacterium]